MNPRVRFWLHGPILPMLLVQGKRTRALMPNLPEADGPFEGVVGEGLGDPMSIAVLGESTAAGVGVARQDEALAFGVARALSRVRQRAVHVQIVGRNATNLRRTREELLPRLRFPSDTVLVVTGVNDTIELTRGKHWSREVRAVTRELKARGARQVVFSGIPPLGGLPAMPQPTRSAVGSRAVYLDALLSEVCAEEGAHHVPVAFPVDTGLLATDGFHPSARGYAAWADALVARWPAMPSTDRATGVTSTA